MRIGPLVLKLRLSQTRFGNRVGGTAELDLATKHPLTKEMAFVVPLAEEAPINKDESGINQEITEQFGVIVAITNDSYQQDKSGLTSYDQLHDVRTEIFDAFLGWEVSWAESMIYYRGGSILLVDSAYLWFMFRFEFTSRLLQKGNDVMITGAGLSIRDIISINTIEDANTNNPNSPLRRRTTGMNAKGQFDLSSLPAWDTIYINYILGSDVRLYDGSIHGLPLADGFPDVQLPNQAQWLDLTVDLDAGDFWRAFAKAFKVYTKEE